MANLSKIRDELIMKKARQQAAIENNAKALKELESVLNEDHSEAIECLRRCGIDVGDVFNIDLSRISTNSEYLQSCIQSLDAKVEEVITYLERILNV